MIQKLDDLTKSQLDGEADIEEGSFVNEKMPKSKKENVGAEVPLIRKREDPGVAPPRMLLPKLPENIDREDLQELFRNYLAKSGKTKNVDTWYDGPVSEEYEGTSSMEDDENIMNPFLRELMKAYEESKNDKAETSKRSGDYQVADLPDLQEEDSAEDIASQEQRDDVIPANRDDLAVMSAAEEEITKALASYVEELSPAERRELTAAVEDKLAVETCAAVTKLSDNCAFMDQFKLTVDDEARNLCNRHQMCYACGAASGRSRGDCDAGYLLEAKSLCEREQNADKCKEEATGMFLLMSKMHSYAPPADTDATCASACVMRYVIGSGSD